MSRSKRTLSSFGQVANNINIDSDTKNKNEKDNKKDKNIIKSIIGSKKTKEETHTFRGYYLENEVAEIIDRITDGKGKGVKSELVNEILKQYFKKEGLL